MRTLLSKAPETWVDGGSAKSAGNSGIDYKRFVCQGECSRTERKIGDPGRKERRKEKRGNRKFAGVLSSNGSRAQVQGEPQQREGRQSV